MASSQKERSAQLAFVSDRRQRGNLDVWLFNLVTNQTEPLTSDDWQDAQPAWSPDGQTVAFISFMSGKPRGLRAVSLPDRTIHTLVSSEQGMSVEDFVWSVDGKSIFYTIYNSQTYESHIWQMDLQTGSRQDVAKGDLPLAISADGQYLGYTIRQTEQPQWMVLRVLRLSDKTELRPTEEQFSPSGQAWAPKENILAVASRGFPQIALYTVDGGQIKQQAVDSVPPESRLDMCDVGWSPDGQKILVVQASTLANVCQGELLLYDAGLMHYQVLLLQGLAGYPRWSRDGRWVVYSRNDTLNVAQLKSNVLELMEGEIWIMESTGFHARPLIKDCGYNGQPAWRP